jgi:hypothetical protein
MDVFLDFLSMLSIECQPLISYVVAIDFIGGRNEACRQGISKYSKAIHAKGGESCGRWQQSSAFVISEEEIRLEVSVYPCVGL